MTGCAKCEEGHFSNSAVGHSACTAFRNCPAGQGRVSGSGSSTADLGCEVCMGSASKWNAADDISACGEHTACGVGSGLSGHSATSAGTCAECGVGTYSDDLSAAPCKDGSGAACPADASKDSTGV